MLTFIAVVLWLAGAAASAQTGRTQSDAAFRARLRVQALANCRAGGTAENHAQLREAGITVEQLCTCAIGRYVARVPTDQLRRELSNPASPKLSAITVECVTEMMGPKNARSPNREADRGEQ